jgi:hypothetical protein
MGAMNSQRVATHVLGAGNPAQTTASALPDWRQVSAEHKQELMVTLAAMIVKQLDVRPAEQREESNER